MIHVGTDISIGTRGCNGYDAERAAGIPLLFIFRMSFVYVHGYLENIFIPTGIYYKVISTLENPRYRDTRGAKNFRAPRGYCRTRGK